MTVAILVAVVLVVSGSVDTQALSANRYSTPGPMSFDEVSDMLDICECTLDNTSSIPTLANYVADMSPTCRRHMSMSPNLGQHCVSLRHRRETQMPNLYQLQPTSTNQPKRTSTIATIEFLCLSSNNNHKIKDMSGIPRHVVKCRVVLDTLPTRHFLVSAT